MGQKQSHLRGESPAPRHRRGKHPEDTRLFGARQIPLLCEAVVDLSLLLTREYAEEGALKLVGGHYQLDVRQWRAVARAACSDASRERRRARRIPPEELSGAIVAIDGYNLLMSVESILANGVLLRGRDGHVRDMASVHGAYRSVEETLPAIRLIGETIQRLGIAECHWFLDSPVSNSGRLKGLMQDKAIKRGWNWSVAVATHVNQALVDEKVTAITSDGWTLDHAEHWSPVAEAIMAAMPTPPNVIDLAPGA